MMWNQWWHHDNGHCYPWKDKVLQSLELHSRKDLYWEIRTTTSKSSRPHECTRPERILRKRLTQRGNTPGVLQFWQELTVSEIFTCRKLRAQSFAAINLSHHFTFGLPFNPGWSSRVARNVRHFKRWLLLAKYADRYVWYSPILSRLDIN